MMLKVIAPCHAGGTHSTVEQTWDGHTGEHRIPDLLGAAHRQRSVAIELVAQLHQHSPGEPWQSMDTAWKVEPAIDGGSFSCTWP